MKYRKTNVRVYISVVFLVSILLLFRKWVMTNSQRTRFNYKPEIRNRISIHLRNIVASRNSIPNPYLKPKFPEKNRRNIPPARKMTFSYEISELEYPEYISGWGRIPQIEDSKWKLAVNSRLKDGADSPAILDRRKINQDRCKSKNLGTDYYRIFEPRAIRYWDMLTEPAIKTAQRKLENFKLKKIIKNAPQGRGIVICR